MPDNLFLNYKFDNEQLNKFFALLDLIRNSRQNTYTTDELTTLIEQDYRLDPVLANIALSEQKLVGKLFESIVDQQAHFSLDHKRIRQLIIDWYATQRTFVSSMRKAIDAYYLSNDELDELIKSFGFPYPNKIISKDTKVGFLYSLISYQKRKGTPWVFSNALSHFGLLNVIVSEWWLHRNNSTGEFYFQSKPIYPRIYKNNTDYILTKTLDQMKDSWWFQTQQNLENAWENSSIKLPSITPFISAYSTLDSNRLIPGIAILQRWMDETYNFWIEYVLVYKNTVKGIINDSHMTVTEGDIYIVGDIPIGTFLQKETYYATALENTGNWTLKLPSENDCVLNEETNTHWVYNNETWVNLGVLLPINLLNSKRRPLNQDIRLTNFRKKYSIMEVMLAIIYMFDSINENVSDPKYIYYNGKSAPLDKGETVSYSGYSGSTQYTGSEVYKNNKIDIDVNKIYSEWTMLSRRPKTKEQRDTLLNYRNERFTEDLYLSDSTNYTEHAICAQMNSGVFLSAINGLFKNDIDNILSYKDPLDTLRLMVVDFECYLMEQAKIIDIPLSYMMLGSPLNSTLRDVVNYFKPYRARIIDISASYGIMDKLADSILEDDSIGFTFGLSWTEKYEEIRDELYVDIMFGITDYFQPRGTDEYYYFDNGNKDNTNFVPDVNFKYEEVLDVDLSEKKTYNYFFVDQCPGSQDYSDSSTINDSVVITVVPI